MNPLIRKHFQDRYEGRLDPVIVQGFRPASDGAELGQDRLPMGSGWMSIQAVRPVPSVLRGFQDRGYTHVGISPTPVGEPPVVADFSIRELLAADTDEYKIERNGRLPLTSHQRDLLDRLMRLSLSSSGALHAIHAESVGSRGGYQHLVRKGYVHETVLYGPRGGRTYQYTPIR